MPSTKYTMVIEPVVGRLTFDMEMDPHGDWLASVRGEPGVIGDGRSKQDAIANAVALYLHVKIMRINRGLWQPTFVKNTG